MLELNGSLLFCSTSFSWWGGVHTIPDINNVDVQLYTGLIQVYKAYKKQKDTEGEDETIIELPELKGHINWTTYQD